MLRLDKKNPPDYFKEHFEKPEFLIQDHLLGHPDISPEFVG